MLSAIMNRRSIRRYRPDAVSRDALEEILRAAALAPSAKNRQPWRFIVAIGAAKAECLDAMERGLEREQRRPLLPGSAAHQPDAWNTLRIMRQAPVVIFVVNPVGHRIGTTLTAQEHVYELCNAQSIGAAMENMVLTAQEHGLGSLWIANTFFAQEELRAILDPQAEPCAALAVGYPDEAPPPRPRKPLDAVVEWRV